MKTTRKRRVVIVAVALACLLGYSGSRLAGGGVFAILFRHPVALRTCREACKLIRCGDLFDRAMLDAFSDLRRDQPEEAKKAVVNIRSAVI